MFTSLHSATTNAQMFACVKSWLYNCIPICVCTRWVRLHPQVSLDAPDLWSSLSSFSHSSMGQKERGAFSITCLSRRQYNKCSHFFALSPFLVLLTSVTRYNDFLQCIPKIRVYSLVLCGFKMLWSTVLSSYCHCNKWPQNKKLHTWTILHFCRQKSILCLPGLKKQRPQPTFGMTHILLFPCF